ncbi:MAG: Crp/Fnr family transcriptional regulator [Scytonema sp. PMC 1069.18]|nr:Crp/Fnr family transcriptional regulator [Scytonema sp. PMC 1069.18]MEC4879869.1 Crp/Fnr family transcriptional regulator [Scytonema sp. PMC 1070.18]
MSNSDIAMHNRLLASLPTAEYQRLHPHLELVSLFLGQELYKVGEPIEYLYFPLDALVSLVSSVDDSVTELGLIGNEGIVGVPALLGGHSTISRAIVQIADGALRVDAEVLKAEFERGGSLQKQLLLYLQLFLTQTVQNGACQAHHHIEPRLARWLLSIQDRLQRDNLSMTQKYIAELLGTRRATITEVAGRFQQAGMIQYKRGEITILDRPALEQTACSCYALLRREQQRLYSISLNIQ